MRIITSALSGATFVAALGGLLCGFDTVVIPGCQQQPKELFHLDGFQQGFMTASALIGAVIGSLAAAKPGDLHGRRDSLKVAGHSIRSVRWVADYHGIFGC